MTEMLRGMKKDFPTVMNLVNSREMMMVTMMVF
jgi:hypothetical protein